MTWDPASGARRLRRREGARRSGEILTTLVAGTLPYHRLLGPPYRRALLDIGGGHAERLMADESGERLAYWPRSWAARALAYVGDAAAAPALAAASGDEHWRVRMTAIQTIGRLGLPGMTGTLLSGLTDPHARVRAASVLALERVGSGEAIEALAAAQRDGVTGAERALAAIVARET